MSDDRPREIAAAWRDLVSAVDEVLWESWDPIGVNSIEGAFDEYTSYAPDLARLALKGSIEGVHKSLRATRIESMGLQPNDKADLHVATLLVRLAEDIMPKR